MAAPRVIKLQVVCSPYARAARRNIIGPGRPDRPTLTARSAAKKSGRDGPTDRPRPRAARRKFWAGTARPTDPAARSAAKIWVGTVPTDRPYLAHPGDVQ